MRHDPIVVRRVADRLAERLPSAARSAVEVRLAGCLPVVRLDHPLAVDRHEMRGPPAVVAPDGQRPRIEIALARHHRPCSNIRGDGGGPHGGVRMEFRDKATKAAVPHAPQATVPLLRRRQFSPASNDAFRLGPQHEVHAHKPRLGIDHDKVRDGAEVILHRLEARLPCLSGSFLRLREGRASHRRHQAQSAHQNRRAKSHRFHFPDILLRAASVSGHFAAGSASGRNSTTLVRSLR